MLLAKCVKETCFYFCGVWFSHYFMGERLVVVYTENL